MVLYMSSPIKTWGLLVKVLVSYDRTYNKHPYSQIEIINMDFLNTIAVIIHHLSP